MRVVLAALAILIGPALRGQDFDAEARKVLAAVVAGDFEAAAGNFNAQMMAALPPATLKDIYTSQIKPQIGDFERTGESWTSEPNGLPVVTIVAAFSKARVHVIVSFDREGKVSGLLFKPAKPPDTAPTRFADYATRTTLRLPFDGEWFVFWGGREKEQNDHVISRDQRFAYDFVIQAENSHSGEGKKNADYYCWDKPILAPAAGTVIAAVDGIADNTPGVMNAAAPPGNHVVIDHGNGEFSLLAHFRKGSVRPKKGDVLKQGDVIGRCGNSGNTSEPHLHYHLQNGPAFGEGEGLPAQFTDYFADGRRVERGEPVKGQRIGNAK
jgi:hypothetical protein